MNYKNTHKRNGKKGLRTLLTCLIPVTCFLIPEAHGVQLHPLNGLKTIKAEISRQGLTRITVKEDRIQNVFGVTGEYVLETDEDQGQVFIRPMGPGSLNSISLTLTTEKGRTQDFLLTPTDKTPEALILWIRESSEREKAASSQPSRQDIEDLIMACQQNRIPVGYKLMPLELKTTNDPHHMVREIRNDHLRVLTFEIINNGQDPINIFEEDFAQDSATIAVLLTSRILKPGEKTYVYVAKKAHP